MAAGTAKFKGIVTIGSFSPRGLSLQLSTLAIDGVWPAFPPQEGETGKYAPTASLQLAPKGTVRADAQNPGRYLATCVFKIDENGWFQDVNAEVEFWLDRVGDIEIAGLPSDRYKGLNPDDLILSSLEINGIEAGRPYSVVFDLNYAVEGEGPMGLRAVIDGDIARSTFAGGRGRLEVQRALTAAQAA